MTTEKIDNQKLFEGQGHIYRRLNDRFDRIEILIEELGRMLGVQFDLVKSNIDDLNEQISD